MLNRLTMDVWVHITGRGYYEPIPNGYSALNGVSISDMEVSPAKNMYLTGSILATDMNSQSISVHPARKIKYNL
jgi:hypothetical protein